MEDDVALFKGSQEASQADSRIWQYCPGGTDFTATNDER